MTHKGKVAVLMTALMMVMAVAGVASAQTSQASWRVSYYSNLFLSDPPVLDTNIGQVNFDWGVASPAAGVPVDNWSARFGTEVTFAPGTYRFVLRADDEARLSINERAVISTIDAAQPGATLTVDVALDGTYKLQIDYRERVGTAFLSLTWQDVRTIGIPTATPTAVVISPNPSQPTGVTAVVLATVLNVRSEPSVGGAVLAKIGRGQSYSVVGKNADSSWYKLNVGGQEGWASAAFLSVGNPSAVPVVGTAPVGVNPSDVLVRTALRLNFRTAPFTTSTVLSVIPAGTQLRVLARNADGSWLRVQFAGQEGWVAAAFVRAVANFNLGTLPVQS
ncbi:MAG: SH3 domain-containing protein [Anaerolineae bacterium]|nr:SH3 domain-containing protein [Anaerolineae bacterium]